MQTIGSVRDFEDAYNASVNSSIVVPDAIGLRDEGWTVFKTGAEAAGIEMMTNSVRLLGTVEDPGFDGRLDFTAHVEGFDREAFASVARLAQAQCATGLFEAAAANADLARRLAPKPVYLDGGGIDMEVPGYLIDQYEVIFSGRLALALSAVKGGNSSFYTTYMTNWAKRLAAISEDQQRVVFSNREFTQEERLATANNFSRVAYIAGINNKIPVLYGRQLLASWACGK